MGQAFLHGTGGGGTGGTLVITAPAGVTCTVSKDGKTKTRPVDSSGVATFKGLDTGIWAAIITDGSQTSAARYVDITADYAETMNFFTSTIAVTFPEGSTCICSDGSTTLIAPTTSGNYTFTVPNAGTWTVTATDGEKTMSKEVAIATDGESQTLELVYILYLYNRGALCSEESGGWNSVFQSKTLGGELYNTWAKRAINTDNIYTAHRRSSDDYDNWAFYFTGKEIDFSGFKTLSIVANGNSKYCGVGVSSTADTSGKIATTATKDGLNTYQLDISTISSGYVFFGTASNLVFDGSSGANGSSGTMYTYEIYLT